MIKRLIDKIRDYIYDSSVDLKDRSFILFSIAVLGALIVAVPAGMYMGEPIEATISTGAGALFFIIFVAFAFKKNIIDKARVIICVILVFVFLPSMFFTNGGVYGGTPVWLLLGTIYIVMILDGKLRIVMAILNAVVLIACWIVGYYYPQFIVAYNRMGNYFDSIMALLIVGTVVYILLLFQNRLYQRENEIAEQKTREAEELNRTQSHFFSSMSHEIRTPINTVLGLNEIILRQEDASEEIRRDARNIQGAGKMLLALINDILDVSKIEAGKMTIVPVEYSVGDIVSEMVNMIWLKANEKGLEFKVDIDPNIPSVLFGDEVRIKQILINILNNAVKYTHEGSITLHMECERVDEENILLKITISDTGMGIPPEAIPHLFDSFQRVDEEKNRYIEGTGLGMSIVKQLIDLMGGDISVNSVYAKGSAFTVTLKQKIVSDTNIGNLQVAGGAGESSGAKFEHSFYAPDARILIVDDNEMNLEVESKLLDGTEIVVDTCLSGEEALNLTSMNKYDLIFMDHLMPEMDGIECMQHIRKQAAGLNNKVPIIVLTANAGSENKELYRRSGFEGYLMKPVSGRALEDMILDYAPKTKIELSKDRDITRLSMNTTRGYSSKIPVLITTGSMCDLPKNVIRKYQIESIPFVVKSEDRMYFDGVEAQTDELLRYMKNGKEFVSEPPSVQEFEKFFARELKKAINVIYISTAGSLSNEYVRASQAAEAYGNVFVFDSGFGSSASGILVLLAQRMASRGDSAEKILEELSIARGDIHCSFVTDGTFYIRKKDTYSLSFINIMKTFNIRPVIRCKEGKYRITQIGLGEQRDVYKKYIDHVLPLNAKPDPDVIFVIYSELSEELQDYIKDLILKRHQFYNIIFQKASAVLALNAGIQAIGVSYIENSSGSYDISSMLFDDLSDSDEFDDENEADFVDEDDQEPEKEWYETIEGIDGQSAIENSGSEETFRTVLKIFYDSLEDKIAEIDGYYNHDDLENYTIKVHAMKSSAKLVGALELSEEARELEKAGKEGDVDYISQHHSLFAGKLRSFHGNLKSLFEGANEEEPADEVEENSDECSCGDYNKFLIKSLYDAFLKDIEENNGNGLKKILDESAQCGIPEEIKDDMAKIKELYEAGDLEGIKAVIGNAEE